MASLEAAFAERKELVGSEASKRQQNRFRLVADPLITVEQLQFAFEAYMKHKGCSDFLRLVGPPPSFVGISWQSPPCPEWLVKISGLAFDIFGFAKNTKIQGVKVKRALNALYLNRQLTYPQQLGPPLTRWT